MCFQKASGRSRLECSEQVGRGEWRLERFCKARKHGRIWAAVQTLRDHDAAH